MEANPSVSELRKTWESAAPGWASRLLARATYVNGDADDASTYKRLDRELAQVERACATGGNRLSISLRRRQRSDQSVAIFGYRPQPYRGR